MGSEQPEMEAQAAASGGANLRLEPLPEPMPSAKPARFGLGKMGAGVVALLLLGGIGAGLIPISGFGPFQSSPPAPVAIEQQAAHPSGPSLIQPVATADIQKAVDGLLISDTEKAKVRKELASGKTKIGWITVSDFAAEDGDWITLSSAGVAQGVPLFHKPTTIAVPYTPGEPVTVTGRVDGDGKGITVAVFVGASSFALTPLQIGTSVQVPTP